ncbi:MAG: hypothetical protein ACRCYP_03535 [Alphaproteobacteria bacterium]
MIYYLIDKDNKYYTGKGFGAFSNAQPYTNHLKAFSAQKRISRHTMMITGSDDGTEPVMRYNLDITPTEMREVKRSLIENGVETMSDRIFERELAS